MKQEICHICGIVGDCSVFHFDVIWGILCHSKENLRCNSRGGRTWPTSDQCVSVTSFLTLIIYKNLPSKEVTDWKLYGLLKSKRREERMLVLPCNLEEIKLSKFKCKTKWKLIFQTQGSKWDVGYKNSCEVLGAILTFPPLYSSKEGMSWMCPKKWITYLVLVKEEI